MSLRKQASRGFVWTFAQQFGNQLIGFFVSLVLARLLLPSEFGLIGMIAIFVSIGNMLLNSGLTQSLVRSPDLDEEDYSTVFYFNFVTSIIIYIIIFFIAPYVAKFYNQDIITNLLRIYCTTFMISSLAAVQQARLTKEMNFKRQAFIAIPATISGGIVGVSLAYLDFGVWSLVWSYLTTSIISTLQLWIYSKWTPRLAFNKSKFKIHFSFGYKLTLSGLLESIFNNIYLIVIGKYFSVAQVGFYTRAETMKQLPVINISSSLQKVTYPLFASIQNDDQRLKRVFTQLMEIVIFVIAPVLIFLAILAEPTFRFLFTEKWLPAVPYFQILCITGILYPIHSYNINILNVKGRSDLVLKLELIKKIVIVITILVAIKFGILALLYGQIFTSVIAFIINTHYTGKLINYNALEQSKDILPAIGISLISGLIIYLQDQYLIFDYIDIVRIILGGTVGVSTYLFLAYILKFNSLKNIKSLILKR